MTPATGDDQKRVTIYTSGSFPNTQWGRSQIQGYMRVCERLYRDLTGKDLLDSQGCVKCLSRTSAVSWADVVARTPDYFQTALCAKPMCCAPGKAKASLSGAQFSMGVWQRFNAVAPTARNTAKPWLKFLGEVHKLAHPSLPSAVGSAGAD